MAYRIQKRRDYRANWETINPILLEGEEGFVLDDPNLFKIGDGVHTWNELPYRGYTGTIAQTLGNNENAVASQKVVTEKFTEQDKKLSDIGSKISIIDNVNRKFDVSPTQGVSAYTKIDYVVKNGSKFLLKLDSGSVVFLKKKKELGFFFWKEDGTFKDCGHFDIDREYIIDVDEDYNQISIYLDKNNISQGGEVALQVSNNIEALNKLNDNLGLIAESSKTDLCAKSTIQGFIGTDGITLTGDKNWLSSDYIPVVKGQKIAYNLSGHTAISTLTKYDLSKKVFDVNIAKGDGAFINDESIADYDGYIRLSFSATASGQFATITQTENTLKEYDIIGYCNKYGFISTDGITTYSDKNWLSSDFLRVEPNTIIGFSVLGHTALSTLTFYDVDKNKIAVNVSGSTTGMFSDYVVTPPSCKYMRLVVSSDNNDLLGGREQYIKLYATDIDMLRKLSAPLKDDNIELVNKNGHAVNLDLKSDSKIFLFGDSISSTNYPWYKEWLSHYLGIAINHTAYHDDATSEELADNIVRGGFSGQNVAYAANHLDRLFNLSVTPDVIVILLGGNDTGEFVGTFGENKHEMVVEESDVNIAYNGSAFIQAVGYIIKKVKTHYYDIITRASKTLPVDMSNTSDVSAIDNIKMPHIVVCTTLPQKRSGGADTWSNKQNWLNKRNAVVECCNKYGVQCVDLYNQSGIDWDAEPEWVAPTQMTISNGINTMDGLHPNKWGYKKIAQLVSAAIK